MSETPIYAVEDSDGTNALLGGRAQTPVRLVVGSPLDTTAIAAGSGTVSVPTLTGFSPGLPYAVAPARLVTVEIGAKFSTSSGKVWNGTLCATAKRFGAGALAITSQQMGIPLELTDSSWDPEIVAVGNNIELHITADPIYPIVPRGTVSISEVDTSADPAGDPLGTARSAVLADGYSLLLYADTGLTPSAPSSGTAITAQADQSGNINNVTYPSGSRPTYLLDGTVPCLNSAAADSCLGNLSYTPTSVANRVLRWRAKKTLPDAASTEIIFRSGANMAVLLHCHPAALVAGTHLVMIWNGAYLDFGVYPSGWHDVELVFGGTLITAWIDGVAGTSVSATSTLTGPDAVTILGYDGNSFSSNAELAGLAYKEGDTSAAERARWIAMANLAWGPHD